MSVSRETFVTRMAAYRSGLDSTALANPPLTETLNFEVARQFRNGVAVIGFALLEDFVRERTREVLERVSSSTLPFDDWPDALRTATTVHASAALQRQLQWSDPTVDAVVMAQQVSHSIASTHAGFAGPRSLSPYSFMSRNPNLAVDDFESVLNAFGVTEPWNAIGGMARRIQGGTIAVKASFSTALERRNHAAHRADAVTEVSDLQSFASDAMSLAASFDCLLSRAGQRLLEADREWATNATPVRQRDIEVAYLLKEGGRWKERRDLARRAIQTKPDLEQVLNAALTSARPRRRAVLILGTDGRLTDWRTTDLE